MAIHKSKEKLQEEVINSLQSIISSCGGQCQIDTLYKDYRELIGTTVPFRQFNHGSFASFLLSSPQSFNCSNRGGTLHVKLTDDNNATHIAKFAREQKKATRKIKGRPKPARRPTSSAWMPAYDIRLDQSNIQQNWRAPFRPVFSRPRNSRPGGEGRFYSPPVTRPMGRPSSYFPNRSQAPPRRPDNARPLPSSKPRSPPPGKPKSPPPGKPKSPPPNANFKPPLLHANFKPPLLNANSRPLAPNANSRPLPPNTNSKCPPLLPTPNSKCPPLPPNTNSKCPPLINVRSPLLPTPPPLITAPPPRANVQAFVCTPQAPKINMAKINPSALYYNDGNFNIPRAIRDNQEKQYAPYFEVPPRFKKTESNINTFKQSLEEEAKRRGFKQGLVFRSIPCGKKNQHWVSVVNINGTSVSSYPEEYANAQDAEEAVAKKALDTLKKLEDTRYPVTNDLRTSIERVEKILSTQGSGVVWFDLVQNLYKENFSEVLPDNWPKEVERYNQSFNIKIGVIVDNPVQDRWTVQLKQQEATSIILAQYLTQKSEDEQVDSSALYECFSRQYLGNQEETFNQGETFNREETFQLQGQTGQRMCSLPDDDSNPNSSNFVTNGVCEISINAGPAEDLPQLPSLELPTSSFWDIYVTYIEHLSSIHFRLIGDKYSVAYDDMVTEMELHYMEDKNVCPIKEPKVGHIYAASYDDSWCRVKVVSLTGSSARVDFLDHGDQEDVAISQLHDLHEKFMELPAQGICCSLAGLEFGGRDQSALNLLQNMALGQTLVAQVVSRDDNISLILYNTSTEDDVNINEKVSEQMDLNYIEPTLPGVEGVAEVYLIHPTSNGDIYVQVETETYKVLQNLLEMARSRTAEILGEDMKIDLTRLYLARFSEDGEWYRAVPRGNVDPNGKVLMWFVDFGNSDRVPTTSIRPLEVNDKLTKIPHQALLCRLHNVPPSEGLQWTSRTCQRMLDLIPDDSPLLLKVHASGSNGGPPMVELFKRLHPKNELVSINATLGMDESLFSSEGDSNNNSLRKEVILSPSRMRNRFGSSNSITSSSSGLNSGPSSMTSQCETTSRSSSPLEMSKRFQQPGSLLPADLPAIGEFFDVYITYAASPSNFAIQPWKMTSKVSSLMEEMQRHYACEENLNKQFDIKVGEYFAVKHNDDSWYRAYLTMSNEGIVSGLFVDFGDCFVVAQDSVQPLLPVFRSLPCQAIKAKLGGIAAANMDWRPEDSYRFKELVEYRELVSIISKIEQDKETSEYILLLRLVDTSDPKLDVYIDDILVDEKRAIKVNE